MRECASPGKDLSGVGKSLVPNQVGSGVVGTMDVVVVEIGCGKASSRRLRSCARVCRSGVGGLARSWGRSLNARVHRSRSLGGWSRDSNNRAGVDSAGLVLGPRAAALGVSLDSWGLSWSGNLLAGGNINGHSGVGDLSDIGTLEVYGTCDGAGSKGCGSDG